MSMKVVHVEVFSRSGCHLCDVAVETLEKLQNEMKSPKAGKVADAPALWDAADKIHTDAHGTYRAPRGNRGGGGPGGPGGPPAMNVTAEKLGDGLYRLTTGNGSYDSVIVEFKDHVMMLEAG